MPGHPQARAVADGEELNDLNKGITTTMALTEMATAFPAGRIK